MAIPSFDLRSRLTLKVVKIAVALVFAVLGAGCATQENQTAESSLVQAERRLARAEKLQLNVEGQAAEYLAVAKISATEIGKPSGAATPGSSRAVALYDRAVADLAADLPVLLRQKNNSGMLALRDELTGETFQLQIEVRQARRIPTEFISANSQSRQHQQKGT